VITYDLYPFQEEGVQFLLEHHYALLGDGMGLGKSLQAIEVIKRTGLKALIVCPAFLRGTWAREVVKFSNLTPILFDRDSGVDYDVAIISYSMLKKAKRLFSKAQLVIGDEIHYVKNISAKRTEYFHDLLESNRPERFIGLSGTAIKNRTPEFYSLLALCSYNPKNTSGVNVFDRFPTYWQFCRKFCHVQEFKIHGRKITKFEGHKNIPELKQLMENKYLRRRASQVLDLPTMIRKDILLSPGMIDEAMLDEWNSNRKAFMSRKMNSAKIKAPHTANYCHELLDQGEGPLVVFSEHVEPTQEIGAALRVKKYKVKVVTGATPMQERDCIVQDFQNNKIDVLVATFGALSTGVTLTASRNMVMNDLSFVPADIAQAEKRINRIGQDKSCVVHRIFWGDIDAHIGKQIDKKLQTLVEVL